MRTGDRSIMGEKCKLSVVVATYNRSETIVKTLEHLAKQTLDPELFEVIVVDDGSPDDTEQVVKSMVGTLPFSLRYIRHENHGPGYTQNRGIENAKYGILVLIADDIFLEPGALQAHLDDHQAHPEPNIAVLGKVLQSPSLSQTVFLKKWDPFKFRLLEGMRELPYYLFWACNISAKKDFLLENGLYDENTGRAGAAAHEDVELGYRLWKKGLRILYNKEAWGYHYHRVTLEGTLRRQYERGINWHEFRAKIDRPDLTVRYHIMNSRTIKDHIETFTKGPNDLIGIDRYPVILIFRQLIRVVVFNYLTVHLCWIPLMKAAERKKWLARFMHTQLYRGVISYHFFKGVVDGYRL